MIADRDAELAAAGERRRQAWARCEVARLVAEEGQFGPDADRLEREFDRALVAWADALADESRLMLSDSEVSK